jgi:prevent-host-death family protein
MTIVMTEQIAAGVFKAKCLRLLDEVQRTRKEIVVTKRGRPVARVVPVNTPDTQWFGRMKGTLKICGDIISPIDEVWDADR